MIKLGPRNETQFRDEIREGLTKAFPGRVLFQITHSVSGEPDTFIRIGDFDMRVEFKYTRTPITYLEQPWKMLREIQQVTMLNMAKMGMNVFLCVCVQGVEAYWYMLHHAQVHKVLKGKAPKWTALALVWKSVRWPDGKWTSGRDYGEEVKQEVSLAEHLLSKVKIEMNGLTKNKKSPYTI